MSQTTNRNTAFAPKVTSKGTELPLLNLQGKPYMQVAHRLVWFREDHPDWVIQTEVAADQEKGRCLAKATISRPIDGGAQVVSTGHKFETFENFGDYIEKAETGAIGRALALCGYGTQFETTFDEGNRIVDAPITPAKKASPIKANAPTTTEIVKEEVAKGTFNAEDDSALIRKNIVSTVYALDAKKIMSKDDFLKHINKAYAVKSIKDIEDSAQLTEVYQYVTTKLNQGVSNGSAHATN